MGGEFVSLCFTSDGGVVVIRVRIIEVVDLDPLSLQLLQFGLQISLGSQEVLNFLFFRLSKNLCSYPVG